MNQAANAQWLHKHAVVLAIVAIVAIVATWLTLSLASLNRPSNSHGPVPAPAPQLAR